MSDTWTYSSHPGSRMDSVATAQAAEMLPIPEIDAAEAQGYPVVVPVRDEPPVRGFPQMVLLTANTTVAQLLPQDTARRNAVVLAVDNDVYLVQSREIGQAVAGTSTGVTGFYLPAGIAVPVGSTAAMWVASTTTATNSRISVLVTKDDD